MAQEMWTVDTAQLNNAANVLGEQIQSYDTQWQRLYSEIENLSSSKWKGTASEQFHSKLEEYRTDFEQMSKLLTGFKEFMISTANGHENNENGLIELISSLPT